MRIAVINERVSAGGTEEQTLAECKALAKQGHKMLLLNFDSSEKDFNINKEGFKWINIAPKKTSGAIKWAKQLVIDPRFFSLFSRTLSEFCPDCIHINNVQTMQGSVYRAIRHYPCVQTIRDYGAVCPIDVCILGDGKECAGYVCTSCRGCGNKIKRWLQRWKLSCINGQRVKSIDRFVAPSARLAQVCTNNGLPTEPLNNPYISERVFKTTPTVNKIRYLYYGRVAEDKGVERLIQAFSRFRESYPNTQLDIAGDVDVKYKDTLLKHLKSCDWIQYHGKQDLNGIKILYRETYCVVVPSLWIENYPNTVLEALCNNTLVIGSSRGGIPELIQNEQLLFDITNLDALCDVLEYTQRLSSEQYCNIIEASYRRVMANNSRQEYSKRLLSVINQVTERYENKRFDVS